MNGVIISMTSLELQVHFSVHIAMPWFLYSQQRSAPIVGTHKVLESIIT